MDLIDGGVYLEAAKFFHKNIRPLRNTVTAYAFSAKLYDEIAMIERSVGSRTSVAHAHCVTALMQKLITDYLRLYLPNCIGYVSPKGKLSAMWEFAVRLDPPVQGVYRSHPDIRCLVCSEQEYMNCNIGVKMEEHLEVCPGFTPEARRRYSEALKKSKKRKRPDVNDDISSLPSSKTVEVTSIADPLHMIYQKIEEGRGILDGMSRVQQEPDVMLGVDAVKGIMGDISELVALALQQAPPPTQVAQPPQAPAPPVLANTLLQALAHAQVQQHAPAADQVQLQAPQAPHPAAAPGQVQLQALQAPHPAAAPGQVQLLAPQAPHPLVQAPGQVPLQAHPAAAPLQAPQPAAAPLQPPLADNGDEQDYYQVFDCTDFLPDLPALTD